MDIQQNASSMAGERHQCGAVDSRQVVALVGECSECLDATSRRPTRPSADRMPRPAACRSGVSFSLSSTLSFPSSSPLSRVASLFSINLPFLLRTGCSSTSVLFYFLLQKHYFKKAEKGKFFIALFESNKVMNRV